MDGAARIAIEEHDFLLVARAIAGAVPSASIRPLLLASGPAMSELSPTAARRFEQTIRRSAVLALGRRGGWRTDTRFAPRGARGRDVVVVAPMWRDQPAPKLEFGPATFAIVRELLHQPLGEGARLDLASFDERGHSMAGRMGVGDHLLAYLAADLLTACGVPARSWVELSARSPLVELAFPEATALEPREVRAQRLPARARSLCEAPLDLLVHALQEDLCRRVQSIERVRFDGRSTRDELRAIGFAQSETLESFIEAASAAGRWDLLSFVVDASRALLPAVAPPEALVTLWADLVRDDPQAPTSPRERQRTLVAITGLLRATARLADEYDALRRVGFVDDDWEHARATVERWEVLGQRGFDHARAVLHHTTRLDTIVRPTGSVPA